MGKHSNIEWTDDTDNVIVVKGGGWWCHKISDGCKNCYAAQLNQNAFYGGNGLAYAGKTPDLALREDLLAGWARQTRPRLHFVASMTDVFGDWVQLAWQFQILDAMAAAPRQIFQILTKRPTCMMNVLELWLERTGRTGFPRNIWPGCSVENQEAANVRLEPMACIAGLGAITWVSYEPALGAVNWKPWGFLRQLIAGGESGPGARPSHPDWHRAARDWAISTGDVAFFFKQWGEWAWSFAPDGRPSMSRVGKKLAGRDLDGRTWQQFPALDHPALAGRELVQIREVLSE